jgi:vacuolar-type H+-ATPase subunit I/STV1
MKRKNASLLGNVLMGLGLVVMVVGVGYSILNQLPQLDLPQFFAHGAILSIFVGAVLWLAGARMAVMNRSATDTGGCATTINAAAAISIATAKPFPHSRSVAVR